MEDCRICGNPNTEGYLCIYSNSKEPCEVSIKEDDKFNLHQRNSHSKQDVLNEFIIRALESIASVSRFHGRYCRKCWKTEFGQMSNCMRCGREEAFVSDSAYNVVRKDSLEVKLSDLERGSLSCMRDSVNKRVKDRVGWICGDCAQSLFEHEDLFVHD